MEPKFWQLRNRIKYVERLKGKIDKEWHGTWDTATSNSRGDCGVCALGSCLRLMNGKLPMIETIARNHEMGKLHRAQKFLTGIMLTTTNRELQELSEFLGLNYLELRKISDFFEYKASLLFSYLSSKGPCQIAITENPVRRDFKETADYIAQIHIKPYLWMIEKHYTVIKEKCSKELIESEAK